MADDVLLQSGTLATPPAGTRVSTEEVTTLNGVTVSAQALQRAILAVRTGNGTASDVTPAAPFPVDPIGQQTDGLTDAELRAAPVPVSAGAWPLPTGAATEATLSALNTKM